MIGHVKKKKLQVGHVNFKHCRREANDAPHELASFCYNNGNSCNGVNEPLIFLLSKLIDNVIIISYSSHIARQNIFVNFKDFKVWGLCQILYLLSGGFISPQEYIFSFGSCLKTN
jgi:hypothetical protein